MAGERHRGTGGPSVWGEAEGVFVIYRLVLFLFRFLAFFFLKALPFIRTINKWSVIDRHGLRDRQSPWRPVLWPGFRGRKKRKIKIKRQNLSTAVLN